MINRMNDALALAIEDQAEVDRIQGLPWLDPTQIGRYLHCLADHWPKEFAILNEQASASAIVTQIAGNVT